MKLPISFSQLGAMFQFNEKLVGLSIGTSRIKVVELTSQSKKWKLKQFGMIDLPQGTIVDNEITNSVALVEAIKTLLKQTGISGKNVATSVFGPSLMIKKISLEVSKKSDLQEQVFWEAEQYLSYDASEVVMDYHLLTPGNEKNVEVLLVAFKRSILDSFTGAIEQAGLHCKVVDTDYFALQNVFEINYASQPSEGVALVDIGATGLKFVVAQDSVPVFTKEALFGGNKLTEEIQRNLNLSFEDAESLKTSRNRNEMPSEVNDLVTGWCEQLGTEIKKVVEFYNASSSGAPISYLLLSGGASLTPGASAMVEDAVGLPAQIMNPFNAISYDTETFTEDYIRNIAPIAVISIGLALRLGVK